jgi:hypothetical protein
MRPAPLKWLRQYDVSSLSSETLLPPFGAWTKRPSPR